MKLVSFRRPDGRASWGIVNGSGVIDCGAKAPSLRDALTQLASLKSDASKPADFQLDAVTLLPPIPNPEKILCVGLNYMTHIAEGGREPPEKPIIFVRFPNSQVGPRPEPDRPQGVGNLRLRGGARRGDRQDLPARQERPTGRA